MKSRSMLKQAFVAMFALGTAIALAGCAGQASSSASASAQSDSSSGSAPSAVSSSADSTSPSSAASGVIASDTVSINLDYNAGTGYEWGYTADVEGILQLTDQSTTDLADAQVTGGSLQDTFTFQAEAPGEVLLTFELKRFWEEGEEPAETQVYAFTVNEDKQVILNPYKSNFENEPVWS